MRIIKKAKTFIVCFCLIEVLLSCSSNTEDGNGSQDGNGSFNIVRVTAKDLLAPPVSGEEDPAIQKAAAGANDFAFRLSAALAKNAGNDNLVCSPYSAWMPLAALVNATNTQNKTALLEALGAKGITENDINKAASRMLYDLTKLRSKGSKEYYNPLRIANAIFVGKDVTLKRDFAQTFMDFYRGSSINVDFLSQDAVKAVNQWASDNTEGLITNVIQEFDPLTVAAIANAIYFSSRWEWEFEPSQTKEDVFHAPGADIKAHYMQREGDAQLYYEDAKVQAMPLRFMTGGGLYILLPKTGTATELLSTMTSDYFDKIQKGINKKTGKLLLPRFSMEKEFKLKETLEALGVPLFDADSAPLTGGLIEEPYDVFVSDAIQKAVIKVDEKGTTAAAVTVLAISTSSGPPPPTEPFEMICNKPFVFILYEYTEGNNQILFTGIVNQPR
jgi:serpin B